MHWTVKTGKVGRALWWTLAAYGVVLVGASGLAALHVTTAFLYGWGLGMIAAALLASRGYRPGIGYVLALLPLLGWFILFWLREDARARSPVNARL
ncbi:MAG TPA: hypothetical protein VGV06_13990 [Methylomirabilota bacterium]|nr:hypothetical protein [Methylomirabilota bacterium]